MYCGIHPKTAILARYRNLRIDKLLEDGRRTVDVNERKQIYSDFQNIYSMTLLQHFLYLPLHIYRLKKLILFSLW